MMMRRSLSRAGAAAVAAVVLGGTLLMRAQSAAPLAPPAGGLVDGSTLLPNGWRLAASGRHLAVGDLPLNVVQSPDGKYLIVTNNGLAKPSFSVIDVAAWKVKSTTPLANAWLGLVWNADGTKVYSAGAAGNNIQEFAFADGALTPARTFALPSRTGETFAGGLSLTPDGRTLFATRVFAMTLSAVDVASGQVTKTIDLAAEPYTSLVSADGLYVFVSLWGGARVQVFTTRTLAIVADITTGEHPSAMALSSDGRRVFVACSSASAVWVIDTFTWEAVEQISTSLFPDAPRTATPNSVAISPDGQKLLVANADNNAVAVVDITSSGRSFVDGFIPVGWYPTGAIYSRDGKQIYVLSGKGLTPSANPNNNNLDKRLLGAISIVPVPDRTALAEYTRRVYSMTPYSDAVRLAPAGAPIGSPIPASVGGSSPIKHVFYVIRENRTYDQILGDVTKGNGDPKLALFGKDITTNAHALADTFVLFDNFYVDAEVSYNGHAYSTAAYSTDFIEKLWQTNYGRRGGAYLGEGGGLLRNPFGNISAPAGGYIWDYARRAKVSVRSYGEFVSNATKNAKGDVTTVATVPGLSGAISTAFAGFDLDITDNRRVDVWTQEFRDFEKNGDLPQLTIIRLGNDHTAGTKPGAPTPRAMVADNDLSVGRVIETVSNSVYWKDSAVFVLEDDAQNGPDHVDSHRSVLLVASPFARRNAADHTFYTTSGVLRTIELILGLPPMSQYDAAATPLYSAFQATPDLSAYVRQPARVALDERNLPTAFGSAESSAMDFSDADRTPELLLNEIVWRSVRGARSPMPPPRRSIFVRSSKADEDADDR